MKFRLAWFSPDGSCLGETSFEANSLRTAIMRAANTDLPRGTSRVIITEQGSAQAPLKMQGRGPLSRT